MIDLNALTVKQRNRYERILQTAEEMMYQQGFYKLSLEQLTKEISVSRSTIYECFGSKEGMVEAIVNRISDRLDNSLEEAVKNGQLNCRDKFIQLAHAQSKNLNANCYRLFNDLKIHMPVIYKQFEERRRNRERNGYKMLIEQGLMEGIFDKDLNEDFLVQLYLKMGQLTADTNILENISMNKQETMEAIIKVFLNGTRNFNSAS